MDDPGLCIRIEIGLPVIVARRSYVPKQGRRAPLGGLFPGACARYGTTLTGLPRAPAGGPCSLQGVLGI